MTKHSKEKLKNPEMNDVGKNWNVVKTVRGLMLKPLVT